MELVDRVRTACAEVAARARLVTLDPEGLERLTDRFSGGVPTPAWDAEHHYTGPPQDVLAFTLTLDAVNFGSGWFPHLAKRPGKSGYFTIALGLKERFEREGPWKAGQLARLGPEACARTFGQDLAVPEQAELMGHFARALNELGAFLAARYAGRFAGPLAEAEGSLPRIAEILAEIPSFQDVARYEELEVPFYKRAQIAAADLTVAPIGEQADRLHGRERLTMFADNLVPHVLRCEGVLRYEPALLGRIEAGELLEPGSPEEVEIRALGVHAVERLVERLAARGVRTCAHELDHWLWYRGQAPEVKAHPRHRTRSLYY